MSRQASAPSLLLALPDPCLLAVLQYCAADDPCSLFSAARAHPRLHQAAAAALPNVKAAITSQHQLDGVLLHLDKYGQYVDSISLKGQSRTVFSLRQLPPSLHLSSLQLACFNLQLQPAVEYRGVLGAVAASTALKQLCLSFCAVLDDGDPSRLASALSQLPAGLEHLSLRDLHSSRGMLQFPAGALQPLQQLTYLELAEMQVQGLCDDGPAQPLQAMTGLVDLQLDRVAAVGMPQRVTASVLSCTHHLTRLKVSGSRVEPDVLAGKTQLQHLELHNCRVRGGEIAQLLSQLQPLQQLTHLSLAHSLRVVEDEDTLPAATYAALTASSKLQHLDLNHCALPEAVWQHVFPTGRRLPHLQVLDISHTCKVWWAEFQDRRVPEGSRLVSCCPGLQSLAMRGLQSRAKHLAPLQQLSELHTLSVDVHGLASMPGIAAEGLGAVCQLTRLRELTVRGFSGSMQELLQLTELKQLTVLVSDGLVIEYRGCFEFTWRMSKRTSDDEPVWRQLLRSYLDHLEPDHAQRATAALAE